MAANTADGTQTLEAEEATEECSATGKKKSKFKAFKKLFVKKKRKESAALSRDSNLKPSQSSSDVSVSGASATTFPAAQEPGTKVNMGNKALSHDSVFISEAENATKENCSQENMTGKVKALQLQLQQNIRIGSSPKVIVRKKVEDSGALSEDDGLPRSPPEISSLHEILARSTNKSSNPEQRRSSLSLEGTDSEDEQVSSTTSSQPLSPLHTNVHSCPVTPASYLLPMDFTAPASPLACLDNSAAKHRIAVKPKKRGPAVKLKQTDGEQPKEKSIPHSEKAAAETEMDYGQVSCKEDSVVRSLELDDAPFHPVLQVDESKEDQEDLHEDSENGSEQLQNEVNYSETDLIPTADQAESYSEVMENERTRSTETDGAPPSSEIDDLPSSPETGGSPPYPDTDGSPLSPHSEAAGSPLSPHSEAAGSPPSPHSEAAGSPPSPHSEAAGCPPSPHSEAVGSPPSPHSEAVGSPPSPHSEAVGSPPSPHSEAVGSPPSPHSEAVGSPPSPHSEAVGSPPSPHSEAVGSPPSPHSEAVGSPPSPHSEAVGSPPSPHSEAVGSPPSPHSEAVGSPPSPHSEAVGSPPSPHSEAVGSPHSPHSEAVGSPPSPHSEAVGSPPSPHSEAVCSPSSPYSRPSSHSEAIDSPSSPEVVCSPLSPSSEAVGSPLSPSSEAVGSPLSPSSEAVGYPLSPSSEAVGSPSSSSSVGVGSPSFPEAVGSPSSPEAITAETVSLTERSNVDQSLKCGLFKTLLEGNTVGVVPKETSINDVKDEGESEHAGLVSSLSEMENKLSVTVVSTLIDNETFSKDDDLLTTSLATPPCSSDEASGIDKEASESLSKCETPNTTSESQEVVIPEETEVHEDNKEMSESFIKNEQRFDLNELKTLEPEAELLAEETGESTKDVTTNTMTETTTPRNTGVSFMSISLARRAGERDEVILSSTESTIEDCKVNKLNEEKTDSQQKASAKPVRFTVAPAWQRSLSGGSNIKESSFFRNTGANMINPELFDCAVSAPEPVVTCNTEGLKKNGETIVVVKTNEEEPSIPFGVKLRRTVSSLKYSEEEHSGESVKQDLPSVDTVPLVPTQNVQKPTKTAQSCTDITKASKPAHASEDKPPLKAKPDDLSQRPHSEPAWISVAKLKQKGFQDHVLAREQNVVMEKDRTKDSGESLVKRSQITSPQSPEVKRDTDIPSIQNPGTATDIRPEPEKLTRSADPQNSDEPQWLSLAKKKAKAWSEMPPIVQ